MLSTSAQADDLFKRVDTPANCPAAAASQPPGTYICAATVVVAEPPTWLPLAAEDKPFDIVSPQIVRYGAEGAWVERPLAAGAGYTCGNARFTDPIFNTVKRCELRGGPSLALPAKPLDETREGACPIGQTSRWQQTRSYGLGPAMPAVWVATDWAPAVAPADSCKPPAVDPVVTSADMSNMIQVDKSKVPVGLLNAGSSTLDVAPTDEKAPDGDGAFRTGCSVSHFGFDDPIVFPGSPGKSHLHVFFGNSLTDATSTPESIRTTGSSTCRGGIANRSAYWVPAMIDTRTGAPVVPDSLGPYYKRGIFPAAVIQPVPVGLRMIAGNPTSTTDADPSGQWTHRFKCVGGPNNENDKYLGHIGNCDVGASLVQEVFFPQCWDGKNLDSPDHKSHMSYGVGLRHPRTPADGGDWYETVCPDTHPVHLPMISFNVVYVVTEKDQPLHWRLSSDNYDKSQPGGYSSHGDWFNGWQKEISDAWAKNCIDASKDCHSHLLNDGRYIY